MERPPELSFRALAGSPSAEQEDLGRQEHRRQALATAGIVVATDLGEAGKVPTDDVLDAAAAAWSASRIAAGAHRTAPADPAPGEPTISY